MSFIDPLPAFGGRPPLRYLSATGSAYRRGPSRDWLKVKVSETAVFVITGYIEGEAIAVAERRDDALVSAGLVKFGLAGKEQWQRLDPLRAGPASRGGVVPVRPRASRRGQVLRVLPLGRDPRRRAGRGQLSDVAIN